MFEQQCDALGPQSLDLQKLQRRRRIFLQPVIAPLAGAALQNLGQYGGKTLADPGNIGHLALRISQDVSDTLMVALDGGGPVAVAAYTKPVLGRDFHEVGGFVEAARDVFVFHGRWLYFSGIPLA